MARLPSITSKDQVAPEDHAIVDGIVQSRGALQGPFTMFLHCRSWLAASRIWAPSSASRARSICGCACSRR